MKKILSFILALLMVVSCASLVFAAEEPAIAEDAAATTTAKATEGQFDFAIKFLESYGIYKGTSATEFVADAESEIQRYQMALFVARISTGWVDDSKWAVYDEWNDGPENRNENRSAVNGVGPYFDDLAGTYAEKVYGAISYAAQKGIIEGYGNNKFGPTDGITYQNALTMVVRTLGYKNLAWPWGYIEKAVTLGLTEGIPSDIAYTDVLNRGAVAQIIYNALFATTKEGDTLAARNFNGGLGWANIIITVCGKGGRGRFVLNDETEYPAYTGPDAGQLIGFRVVNEDGTLGDKTYWVKNGESFNLPAHTERYLGHAYKALFTQDENSQFVNMLYFKALLVDDDNDNYTVWNYGRLKKTADGEYPIYAYLKNYTLVSKFNKDTYLNKYNGGYGYGEYILKSGLQGGTVKYTSSEHKYGINWITGDIVERTDKDSADYSVLDTDGKTVLYFKTSWYYNDKLGVYFKYVLKGTDIIGIDILDEADIQKLIDNSYIEKEKAVDSGYVTILTKDVAKTAYASLKSFILNDFNTPDYGIFEEYRLGQYTTADVYCAKDDAKKAGFEVLALDAVATKIWADKFNAEDFPGLFENYKALTKDGVQLKKNVAASGVFEGSCDHGAAWISEDGYTPANGDYVIYNYDKPTGELKIVKIIYDISSEKADKDNFVATGIVRAYNVPNKTVTIGDKQYSYDYPELAGLGLRQNDGDGKILARAAFTYLFKSLFNQYVTYVVCDGKLVHIELKGKSSELIIVDSYAGLSSDGYIVVNGYKTDDLTYTQFRIGSYNGWVKGDYFYYPSNAEVDKAFYRGTIYQIQSYDDNEKVYFVNTVALKPICRQIPVEQLGAKGVAPNGQVYSWSFMDYDYDDLKEKNVIGGLWSIGIPKAGYKVITEDGTTKDAVASASSDKYVLICNPIWNYYEWSKGDDDLTAHDLEGNDTSWFTGGDYAPIIVYTGKGGAGWYAEGYKVSGTSATVLINVDFSTVVGFDRDQYDLSYVLFLTYDYETAAYDGADADSWYLLGASQYTARVFNFYNGKVETRIATNKDLKKGYSYPSINGVIVNDTIYDATRLNLAVPGAYLSGNKYLFGHGIVGKITGATTNKDDWKILFDKELTSKKILSYTDKYSSIGVEVKDLSTGTSVFLVSHEPAKVNGIPVEKITEIEKVTADEFAAWLKANNYDIGTMYFWYIHTVGGGTVYYIERTGNKLTTIDPFTLETSNLLDVSNDTPDHAYIEGVFTGTATQVEDDDGNKGLIDATLNQLSFEFIGPATYDTHEAVDTNDFHFGHPGYCVQEDWETIIDIDGKIYRMYGTIFEVEYDPQDYDLTRCLLIKKVNLDFTKLVPVDLNGTNPTPVNDDLTTAAPSIGLPLFDATGALVSPITITTTYKDSCGTEYSFVIELYTVAGPVIAGYQTYKFMAIFSEDSAIVTLGEDYPRDYPIDDTLIASTINSMNGGAAAIPVINREGYIDIRTGAAFPKPYAVKPY